MTTLDRNNGQEKSDSGDRGPSEAKPEERKRVCTLVRNCLGNRVPNCIVVQVERVLWWTAFTETRQMKDSSEIVSLLKSKGWLPDCLLEALESYQNALSDEIDLQVVAICFSACIFPRRFYSMSSTRKNAFLQNFLASFDALLDGGNPSQHVKTQKLSSKANSDVEQFIDCLVAVDWHGTEDQEERQIGACLYIMSCPQELLEKMWNKYLSERALLAFVKDTLNYSPSQVCVNAIDDKSMKINWGHVRQCIADKASDYPGLNINTILNMERQSLFPKITYANWSSDPMKSQVAGHMWEHLWKRLVSGFPYYAFEASLAGWWGAAAKKIKFEVPGSSSLDNDSDPVQSVDIDIRISIREDEEEDKRCEITKDLLRFAQKGFVVVLTTFLHKKGQKLVDAETFAQRKKTRQFISDLWTFRLIHSDDDLSIEPGSTVTETDTIQEIAEKHDINVNTTYADNRSLEVRYRAYTLASNGWAEKDILLALHRYIHWNVDEKTRRQRMREHPFIRQVISHTHELDFGDLPSILLHFAWCVLDKPGAKENQHEKIMRVVCDVWTWAYLIGLRDTLQYVPTGISNMDHAILDKVSCSIASRLFQELNSIKDECGLWLYLQDQRDILVSLSSKIRDHLSHELDSAALIKLQEIGLDKLQFAFCYDQDLFASIWYLILMKRYNEKQAQNIMVVECVGKGSKQTEHRVHVGDLGQTIVSKS